MSRRSNWSSSAGCIALSAAIVLCLGASTTAAAGSATLTWTAPTENENGTALTDLSGFRVLYGLSPSALTQSAELTNPGLRSYVVEGLPAGKWYFAMTALAGSGPTARESQQTNVVNKDVTDDPPPPDELRTSAPDVYSLLKQTDAIVFVKVGTVPLGTLCADQRAGDYFVVPRAAVTFDGLTRPIVVFAACD